MTHGTSGSLVWMLSPAENIQPALPVVVNDSVRLHELVELIEAGLAWVCANTSGAPDTSNELAAVAGISRAVHTVRAAATLCLHGFYTESRVMIRTAYESAALARTLAHDQELADRWLRKSAVVPDRISRDYAKAMSPDADGDAAHRDFYKQASMMAHPSAQSTVPYVVPTEGPVAPRTFPTFDAAECKATMREIVAEAALVGYCFRNSFAVREAAPPAWWRRLAELADDLTGGQLADLQQDWAERERRHHDLFPAAPVDD
jgi:hypothetical protein